MQAAAVQAHDVQRLLKDACSLASQAKPVEQANWACVRAEMFPPSEENQYRHLRIADFSDTVSALPPEELQVELLDPLLSFVPFLTPSLPPPSPLKPHCILPYMHANTNWLCAPS